ncbi:restriction endonuclease subunit S [Aeromonas sp. 602658]|uniref:restriction endonuclease subunit S n=1 Tax=Aeromonas sp. 602658 TaxID=2712043 RepID=UPI003BA0FFEB
MSDKQTVKFGDICREVKLTTKDPIAEGYERYIGLEHLDSGSLKIKRWGIIAEDNPSFTRVFKKGHILFGKRRPYLKKAAIAEFDGICSGDIIVLDSKKGGLAQELLPFAIQSSKFWNWAIKTSSGSLSPRTKFSALSDLDITLPSDNEQNNLRQLISKKEDVRRINSDLMNSSARLLRVLLQDFVCTKSTENSVKKHIPAGWSLKKLKQVANYQLGKAFPSTDYCESGVKLLRPGNLYSNGLVNWSAADTTYLPIRYLEENPNYVVGDNEIVMNLTAQSLDDGFLGRVCMTQKSESCLLNQRLARITPFEENDSDYLYWALQSRLAREYLHRMPVGTKVKHLYNFEVENIPILIPNDKITQQQYAKVMNAIANLVRLTNDKTKSLDLLSHIHDKLIS